jgi:hypothetical protein
MEMLNICFVGNVGNGITNLELCNIAYLYLINNAVVILKFSVPNILVH